MRSLLLSCADKKAETLYGWSEDDWNSGRHHGWYGWYGWYGWGNHHGYGYWHGGQVRKYSYDVWGNNAHRLNFAFNTPDVGYTGKHFDSFTKTYNYGFRRYSPFRKQFMTEDPIRDGYNWYAYTTHIGDPVNYYDADGRYSEIVVSGNDIEITVPITFSGSGADSTNIGKVIKGIEKEWSGTFGKYTVKTKVKQVPDSINVSKNSVKIQDAQGRAMAYGFLDVGGNKSIDIGLTSATLYTQDESGNVVSDLGWVSAHETGHLMGLRDYYSYETGLPEPGWANNIMGKRGKSVNEKNIDEILASTMVNKITTKEGEIISDPKVQNESTKSNNTPDEITEQQVKEK